MYGRIKRITLLKLGRGCFQPDNVIYLINTYIQNRRSYVTMINMKTLPVRCHVKYVQSTQRNAKACITLLWWMLNVSKQKTVCRIRKSF